MADYITLENFRQRHNITSEKDSVAAAGAITEASRLIDSICGRRFDGDTSSTTRTFHPIDNYVVWIDDAHEITSVATDDADDASYSTTWAAADYEAWPLNGVGPNSQSGWPTTRLVAVEARRFPRHRRASVQVDAKWGWAAVPADIAGACYLLANRLYEERKAPFGTVASVEFGALPLRDQRTVNRILMPYKRTEPVVY